MKSAERAIFSSGSTEEFTGVLFWSTLFVVAVPVALNALVNPIKQCWQMFRKKPVLQVAADDDTWIEKELLVNNYVVVPLSPEAMLDNRLAPLLRRTQVGGGLIEDGGELAFDMATALERMLDMIMQSDAAVD
jgi:hypothetical protein